MTSIEVRLEMATAELKRIEVAYESDAEAQLLELMAAAKKELLKHELASYSLHHSSKTLVHPRNRGNAMLEVSDVPGKVADISDVAFSYVEVSQAAAVRMPGPGTPERKKIEQLNAELVASSAGTLAPVMPDVCEIMVISCNHNTSGLKAVDAKAKCDIERISQNGVYSKSKIIERCPTYADPLNLGLTYFVMDYPVEQKFPLIVDLFMEACNIGAALAKPDNAIQLMTKAHRYAKKDVQDGKAVNYDMIVQKMSRSKPLLAPLLPQIGKYVEKWAGGVDAKFLDPVSNFAKGLQEPHFEAVTVPLLTALNEVDMGTGRGGRIRSCILKGLLKYDGYMSHSTIKKLGKEGNCQNLAFKFEAMLVEIDTLVAKHTKGKVVPSETTAAIGDLEISCVSYAFGIHGVAQKHKSLKELFAVHYPCIAKSLGLNLVKFPNPYVEVAKAAPEAKAKGKAQKTGTGLQELTQVGLSPSDLERKTADSGMVEGEAVYSKHDENKVVYLVHKIKAEDDEVTLQQKADKRKKVTVSLQMFADRYSLVQETKMVTEIVRMGSHS